MVKTLSAQHCVLLWTADEFEAQFGRHFNQSRDFVGVMNGDQPANNVVMAGATNWNGEIWCYFDRNISVGSLIRINWLVALG